MTTLEDMIEWAKTHKFCTGCGSKLALVNHASEYSGLTGEAVEWRYGLECTRGSYWGHTAGTTTTRNPSDLWKFFTKL